MVTNVIAHRVLVGLNWSQLRPLQKKKKLNKARNANQVFLENRYDCSCDALLFPEA